MNHLSFTRWWRNHQPRWVHDDRVTGVIMGWHFLGVRHEPEFYLIDLLGFHVGVMYHDGFFYRGWRFVIGR